MRILTVCEDGINRSVTARWLLQHEGHEVIAIGIDRTSADTLDMLCAWADRVILLVSEVSDLRMWLARGMTSSKCLQWTLGPASQYPHHLNPDLVREIRAFWLRDRAKFDSGPRV